MLQILFSLFVAYESGMVLVPEKATNSNCSLGGRISFDGKQFKNVSFMLIHSKRKIRVEGNTDQSGYFCANFDVHLHEEYELYIYYPFASGKSYFYRLRLKYPKNKFDRNHERTLYKE